jgi:protein ImuA
MATEKEEMAAALRRRLRQNHPSTGDIQSLGHPGADRCLNGGLNCGALHEIFPATAADAPTASGFVLALAARLIRKSKWLLWVQQDFPALEWGEILGTGLLAFGFDPARLLIVKVPNAAAALRSGAEGLNCHGLGAVVIELWGGAKAFDLVASRRLTLATAKHGIAAFTLRHAALPAPTTAETRWLLRAAPVPAGGDWGSPRFDAELLRNRHGGIGRWIMEWDCNGSFHETGTANSRALSSAPGDRSPAPQTEGLRHAV